MIEVNPWDVQGGDSRSRFFFAFMNLTSLIGKKIDQTQGFLEDGRRVPLSIISVAGNIITQIKTQDREGYNAIQLGFGNSKKITKPLMGHIKKTGTEKTPRFFREIRIQDLPEVSAGKTVSVEEVFEAGDVVDVEGTSKGKGFAGVVKRHGFHGGPKTHGQSDRHRAPGSIGSGTTPGRVYKGKKMAGRMGSNRVTIKNLEILGVEDEKVYVKGLIPGVRGGIVVITKVGKNKKFVPLYSKKEAEEVEGVKEVEAKPEVVEETVEEPRETQEEVSHEASEVPNEEKSEDIEKKEVSSDAEAMEDKKENAG